MNKNIIEGRWKLLKETVETNKVTIEEISELAEAFSNSCKSFLFLKENKKEVV